MAYTTLTCSSVGAAPTRSCTFQMQRTPELRFCATLGREPEVEPALIYLLHAYELLMELHTSGRYRKDA